MRIEDCETTAGIWVDLEDRELKEQKAEERVIDRYQGRIAASDIVIGFSAILARRGRWMMRQCRLWNR